MQTTAPHTDETLLLARALRGGHADLHALVQQLTPVVRARVARALVPFARQSGRNLREEVEDLSQEVFTTLFQDDAATLRTWDPARGASLRGFVGLIAQRRVQALLNTRKHNPWSEAPLEDEAVQRLVGDRGVEQQLEARDALRQALARVDAAQTERGKRLLRWLVVEGLSVDDVQERTAMTRASVYQWRSRLLAALRTALVDGATPHDGSTP